jgi:hypothetical protein
MLGFYKNYYPSSIDLSMSNISACDYVESWGKEEKQKEQNMKIALFQSRERVSFI